MGRAALVILLDAPICPFGEIQILMQLVLEQRLAESNFYFAFAGVGVLPSLKTHGATISSMS
jgi:hypothetical protein